MVCFYAGSSDENPQLIMSGGGASAQGDRPFLNLLDLKTTETVELWRCKEGVYEVPISILNDDVEDLTLDNMKILFSSETNNEPPQFFVRDVRGCASVQITDFPHPYPSLKGLQKEIIRYSRSDGVQLTAKLYLPPGYNAEEDGPIPMLMWAYPKEFKNKEAAGQVADFIFNLKPLPCFSESVYVL